LWDRIDKIRKTEYKTSCQEREKRGGDRGGASVGWTSSTKRSQPYRKRDGRKTQYQRKVAVSIRRQPTTGSTPLRKKCDAGRLDRRELQSEIGCRQGPKGQREDGNPNVGGLVRKGRSENESFAIQGLKSLSGGEMDFPQNRFCPRRQWEHSSGRLLKER